jgi:hypothetical protein
MIKACPMPLSSHALFHLSDAGAPSKRLNM